jgi:hypothetical protein
MLRAEAQPGRTAVVRDPYARWCGRGGAARRPPIPINDWSPSSECARKVTNGFRSEWGARAYAALCSIVETGRRKGRNALTAIRDALATPATGAAGA